MADDIDIEEHDLLDNPRIRNIFPDLSKIKTEVPDYDEHEGVFTENGFSNSRTQPLSTGSSPNSVGFKDPTQQPNSSREAIQFEDAEVHYSLYKNKIIIGSKPSQSTVTIKKEIPSPERVLDNEHIGNEHVFEEDAGVIEPEASSSRFGGNFTPSVFILGSKPNNVQPTANSGFDLDADVDVENDPKVYNSSVLLTDWGPRLECSVSYCKECEILFATRNALDVHNTSVHSFLVAVPSPNKAVKSTSRGIFRTATNSGAPSTSKGKFCNHCNKYFMDDTKLIKHLYENLLKCNTCDKFFKTEAEFKDHMETHDDDNSDEEENSEFYRCALCSCYFKKKSRYVRHSKAYHNVISINLDLTLVSFGGKCAHCGTVSANAKSYNRHILNHHHEFAFNKQPGSFNKQSGSLNKQSGSRPSAIRRPLDVSPDNQLKKSDYKYRCRICKQIFSSYYAAGQHKILKHPAHKQQHVLDKIRNKHVPIKRKPNTMSKELIGSKLIENQPNPSSTLPKEVNYSENVYKGVGDPPIPKTVLFKCNQCEVNFTSCSAGVAHAKDCRQYKGEWRCQICQREFRLSDKKIHMSQHLVSERFQVYICVENLYGRVLCKCPDCQSFFHEQEFWSHYRHGCGKFESVICNVCDFPINMSSIKIHNHWHKVLTFSDKDLILIEFVHHNKKDEVNTFKDNTRNSAKPNLKRKIGEPYNVDNVDLEEDDFEAPKQSKYNPTDKITLYYCSICKVYVSTWRGAQMHLESKCKTAKLPHRKCKTCGLTFVNHHHQSIHQGNRIVRLSDYKVIRIQDKKVINPPMPTYPKCRTCYTHFCTKTALAKHDCDDSHKMCVICNKSFSDLAYKLHMAFHEYGQPVPPKAAAKIQEFPELLKQYERLTRTWNVLYSCDTCDIVCDFYDKAVEHCQNHYSNMESYGMTIKKCLICKLKFDETCFGRHMELHNENVTINRDSFQILSYKYTSLLSDDWFELFGTLPKPQIEQIVSRSVYNLSRNVKMTLIKEGSPEFTLYKCGKCEKFVNPQTVSEHHKYASCSKEKRHTFCCTVCKIPFSSYSGMSQHKNTHPNSSESCRVVLFNSPGDEEFNRALRVDIEGNANDKSVAQSKRALKRTHDKIAKKPSYTFYKCERCQCCAFQKKFSQAHICGSAADKTKCPKCGLYVKKKGLYKHLGLHKSLPDLIRRNIKLISYTPQGSEINGEEKTFQLFKCQCGLHFTSMKSVEKHFEVCRPEYKVSKENCSKCGLLFATDVLVSHLCSHHKNDEHSKFDVVQVTPKVTQKTSNTRTHDTSTQNLANVKSKCLFKCVQCNIHYLKNASLYWHVNINHRVKCQVVPCALCGLNFTTASVTKHISLHHQKLRYQLKDFKIVTNKSEADEAEKAEVMKPFLWSKEYLSTLDLKHYSHILYKCNQCSLHFITRNAYIGHNFNGEHNDRSGIKCTKCGLIFGYQTIKKHEYIHHESLKLKGKDFEITEKIGRKKKISSKDDKNNETVTQNDDEFDASAPGPIREYESDNDTAVTNETQPAKKPPKLSNRFLSSINLKAFSKKLFKCKCCGQHYNTKMTYVNHVANVQRTGINGRHTAIKCKTCGLLFPYQTLPRHQFIHHKKFKLKRDDFQILIHSEKPRVYVKNNVRHFNGNKFKLPEKKQGASQLYQWSKRSHSALNLKIYDKTVYKCNFCGLHFLTKSTVQRHLYRFKENEKHLQNVGVKCTACGLLFTAHTLSKHIHVHHEKKKLKREDLQIFGVHRAKGDDKIVYTVLDNDVTQEESEDSDQNSESYETRPKLIDKDKSNSTSKDTDDCESTTKSVRNNKTLSKKSSIETDRDDESNNDEPNEPSLEITNKDTDRTSNNNSSNATTPIPDYTTDSKKNLRLRATTKTKTTTNNISLEVDLTEDLQMYYLYKCNDCGVHFVSENSLNTHVARDDHEIPKVACDDCGFVFTLRSLGKHKNIHHEKVKLLAEDFHVILHKKRDTPTKLKKYLPKQRFSECLYRCDICSLNFLRSYTLEWHIKHLDHDTDKVKCDFCGFMFSKISLEQHISIHHDEMKLKKEDFRICRLEDIQNKNSHEITTDNEKSTNSSNDADSVYDLGLASSSVPVNAISTEENGNVLIEHVQLNNKLKENSESIINVYDIDNTIVDEVPSTKDTIDNKSLGNTTIKLHNNTLYKCNKCTMHFLSEGAIESHFKSNDHNISKGMPCKICGLIFHKCSLERHVTHHETSKLKLKDFHIIPFSIIGDTFGNNYVYQCNICKCNFLREEHLEKHMANHISSKSDETLCSEEQCKKCGLFFKYVTLQKHMSLHHRLLNLKLEQLYIIKRNYLNGDIISESDKQIVTTDGDCDKTSDKDSESNEARNVMPYFNISGEIDPELYDNNLYKCRKCGLHFLKKNSLGSHMRTGHRSNLSRKETKCLHCGLLFTIHTLSRHNFIHHEQANFKLEDFRILDDTSPDDETISDKKLQSLGTDEESDTTDSAETEEAADNADGESLLRTHSYNDCLYKCTLCRSHFLAESTLDRHLLLGWQCQITPKKQCSICGLEFSTSSVTRHVSIHHDKMSLKLEDFKIVDKTPSRTSKKNENAEEKSDNPTTKLAISENRSERQLYKCGICSLHFMKPGPFKRHMTISDHNTATRSDCSICGLAFNASSLTKHFEIHHRKMKLNLEDFRIVNTNQEDMANHVIEKESTASTPRQAIHQTNASIGHSSKKLTTETSRVMRYTKNLYKCSDCLLHFCSIGGLKGHLNNKDFCSSSSRSSCPICGLTFACLEKHTSVHHEKMNLKVEDFNITSLPTSNEETTEDNENKAELNEAIVSQSTISCEDVDSSVDMNSSKESEENDKIKSKKQKTTLYKCGDCNVYFVTQATCYKHVVKHKRLDSKEFIECKFCGFQFKIVCLPKHMNRHHSKDFNLEDVLVEEYQPSVQSNVTPKIDIYYAINKVQSRLVSTTTEPSKETNLSAETLMKPHSTTLDTEANEPSGTHSHNIESCALNAGDADQEVILSSSECEENRGEVSCMNKKDTNDPHKEKLNKTVANTKQMLHVESPSDLTYKADREKLEETMAYTKQTLHGDLSNDLKVNMDKEKLKETMANTKQTLHGELSNDLTVYTETTANTKQALHGELSSDLTYNTDKGKLEETNTKQTLVGEMSNDLTNNTDKGNMEDTIANTKQTLHGALSNDLLNNTDKEKLAGNMADTIPIQMLRGELSNDLTNYTETETSNTVINMV